MRRGKKWPNDLPTISSQPKGIEWLVAITLYRISPAFVSFRLQQIFPKERHLVVIEVYVIVCVAFTVFTWWLVPVAWWWLTIIFAILCSYFSLSTVVTLLHVVFLSKPLGPVEPLNVRLTCPRIFGPLIS